MDSMGISRQHLADFRGVARLVCAATVGVTDIVEQMHRTIQLLPGPVGREATDPTNGIAGLVYRAVRGCTEWIGRGIDAGLRPLQPLLLEADSTAAGRDIHVAALNGVYGDYLARTQNPLAIEMALRHRGRPVDPGNPAAVLQQHPPGNKLLVLVHGLCMSDWQWLREGHDHGAALADELAYTPLYLNYNSGQSIAANGRALSALLERLVAHWPGPLDELVIMGHSMGGLVARSACHQARIRRHIWLKHLAKLVFLGTPHHGTLLERGGRGLDFLLKVSPYSAPFARIGQSRSAGIMDLSHGNISGKPQQPVPLPDGVTCYVAAGLLTAGNGGLRDQLVGDGLVPLNSALGSHRDAERDLAIPASQQWVGYNSGHLDLLKHPGLYAQLRDWLY